ncbi:MAG: polyribonucleotide nucleotidyltransferase [Patescibacteria group bacterium]
MPNVQKFSRNWGGKELTIEVGRYASAAGGACTIQYGDTVVLATATMSKEIQREGLDFFPLMVEYEEKLYAAGRIKGSRFIKKEGRPTDEAMLVARYIDRAIRPLFNQKMRNDVQVIATVLAFDGENDPDILALIGASCALTISDIPWNGPLSVARASNNESGFILNPTYVEREASALDLSVAGTPERILMVEAGCNEVPEDLMLQAFEYLEKNLATPIELIQEVQKAVGKTKVDVMSPKNEDEKVKQVARERVVAIARPFCEKRVTELFFGAPKATKTERAMAKSQLKTELKGFLLEQGVLPEELKYGTDAVGDFVEEQVTNQIIENGKRVDGRGLDEIRSLFAEVAVLPRVHGTGHFMRGETQVLSAVTLGAPGDEQTLDGMELVGKRRFFHHYNFPPYSVGEVKPMRGPGRREIGHGALAEKALEKMIPVKEDFPYTIRVVSEVLGSNGSSSMGSTCGATLALMDAGVPIKQPVAGIAMGLASTPDMKKWKVITDLQDLEDGEGGMDFKITGTKNGITAIQLDTKTIGLTHDIIVETITRAKTARLKVLDVMLAALPAPRAELSQYAPRITTLQIDPSMIGGVIGPGGKVINEIIDTTGVTSIDIDDNGLVMITSLSAEAAEKAYAWVKSLVAMPEVGTIYEGKVTKMMDFGAFVEIMPKKEGLVHVSEMAPYRVGSPSDIVKVGDKVKVKLFEIDSQGRLNLSMKQAPGNVYPEKPAGGASSVPSGDRRPPARPRH